MFCEFEKIYTCLFYGPIQFYFKNYFATGSGTKTNQNLRISISFFFFFLVTRELVYPYHHTYLQFKFMYNLFRTVHCYVLAFQYFVLNDLRRYLNVVIQSLSF